MLEKHAELQPVAEGTFELDGRAYGYRVQAYACTDCGRVRLMTSLRDPETGWGVIGWGTTYTWDKDNRPLTLCNDCSLRRWNEKVAT